MKKGEMKIGVQSDLAPWAVVDLRIFKLKLSPTARLVLGWVAGRPPGWDFRLGYMLHCVNLGEPQWRRARLELIKNGFFCQSKRSLGRGKFVWDNKFILNVAQLDKHCCAAAEEKEYTDQEF